MHNPDKWLIVKIDGDDPHYRVFGTWTGGYLDPDTWRMNSGIVRTEDDGDFYLFYGASGSVYRCHKEMYGSTAFGWGVMNTYLEHHKGKISIVDRDTVWKDMDWLITA